jgi:hypothetical protein
MQTNEGQDISPAERLAFELKNRIDQAQRYAFAKSLKIGQRVKIIKPSCLLYFREMDDKLYHVIATVHSINSDPKEHYCVTITLPDLGIYIPDTEIDVCPDGIVKV